MSNLKEVVSFLINDRKGYRNLSIKDKSDNFFIINRLLSKKYPLFSNKLNIKSIDKSLALDMWFIELGQEIKKGNVNYTFWKWFWSKGNKNKPNDLSDKENSYLMLRLGVDQEDLNFLLKFYGDEVKEESKYFKKLDKQ